jgi:hypothetical protein
MRRLVLVATVLACVLLWLPAVAQAGVPRLLTSDYSSDFAVRPVRIVPTGDGSSFIGQRPGKGGAIRWKTWTQTRAYGVGTFWINDGIPYMAAGTLHPHRATLDATRVRHGRYTRLTVRFRAGSRVWDKGDTLYVNRYRLSRAPGDYGYMW